MGLSVLLPDINRSSFDFECTSDGIIYGLGKIKTVKTQVIPFIKEREKKPYRSFKDFVARTGCSEKMAEVLIYAGCFDGFRRNMRKSNMESYKTIAKLVEQIKKKTEACNKDLGENPKKKDLDALNRNKEALELLTKEYKNFEPDVDTEEDPNALRREYEILSAYLSSHPLDAYREIYRDKKVRQIADFTDREEAHYVGLIRNLRLKKRKSDGKPMAFFTLEDPSGSIEVCCFTKSYEKYCQFIKEEAVVDIYARGETDEESEEDTGKLIVVSIQKIKPYVDPVFLSIPSRNLEMDFYCFCEPYSDENGHPVWLHYRDSGCIKQKKMSVRKEILENLPDYAFGRLLYAYKKKDYS